MPITLKAEDEQFIKNRARELGYQGISEFLADLAAHEKQRAAEEQPDAASPQAGRDWAWAWIDRIAGSATGGLSTDQVMEMTRSER